MAIGQIANFDVDEKAPMDDTKKRSANDVLSVAVPVDRELGFVVLEQE